MTIQCFSHVGLCVTDLARAETFYIEGLGFEREGTLRVAGEPSETLLGLAPCDLEAVYLVRDGVRIELLQYHAPGTLATEVPRPMNQLGLTHLSLRVADLQAALEQSRRAGGTVLEPTRIGGDGMGAVFVLDPDGLRVELVQSLGDPTLPPGHAESPRRSAP